MPNPLMRASSSVLPRTDATPSFIIDAANKSYRHQYANIYFLRLRLLRGFVEREAHRKWDNVSGSPRQVSKVLEVTKGQLCFIVGTVYMDMPLKPNVLEDIGRDQSIPAPPPLEKIWSPDDSVMLEDESGRIRLVGDSVQSALLVTGVIAGALGVETNSGDFEVVDLCFAGMASQEGQDDDDVDVMDVDEDQSGSSGVSEDYAAFVSGLDVGSSVPADAHIQMLAGYLSGEEGGSEDQIFSSRITRLVILGNSLAPIGASEIGEDDSEGKDNKARKYGHDNTCFSPHPILSLSGYLLDIAHSMPVHLLAGESDPSGTIMPQQPLPRAMFGDVSNYTSFTCETNPTFLRLGEALPEDLGAERHTNGASSRTSRASAKRKPRTILASSGQPINDMFKYLPTPPATRLNLAEATLRWRHMAPTAPDTLWCHPFFTTDPFVLSQTPDIYANGCQPRFATRLVRNGVRRCRIVLVPSFAETGVLVLVELRSLNVRTVKFAVRGMLTEAVNRTND